MSVPNYFAPNSFAISFLIVILFNILNFGIHDNNCIPNFFPYDFEMYLCNIKIINGSFYCYDIHIHHWILGAVGLFLTLFLKDSLIKSALSGILFAVTLDGLLFSDRFTI
jgi:hypothetical protein